MSDSKKPAVVEPDDTPVKAVTIEGPHRFLDLAKSKIVLGVLAAIIVAGGAYLLFRNPAPAKIESPTGQAVANQVCSDKLLREASNAINKSDLATLSNEAQQIVALPGYDHDINCLYVVEWSAMQHCQTDNAKKYLSALNSVFNTQTYSKALSVAKLSPTQFADDIASQEQITTSNNAQDKAAQANLNTLDQAADNDTSTGSNQ